MEKIKIKSLNFQKQSNSNTKLLFDCFSEN